MAVRDIIIVEIVHLLRDLNILLEVYKKAMDWCIRIKNQEGR